jgi:hypothetical protein
VRPDIKPTNGVSEGFPYRLRGETRPPQSGPSAARDLALGAGTLAALRDGRDVARWLAVGAAADLADTVILADATRRGSFSRVRGSALVASAAGGALVGAAAALGMRRR